MRITLFCAPGGALFARSFMMDARTRRAQHLTCSCSKGSTSPSLRTDAVRLHCPWCQVSGLGGLHKHTGQLSLLMY